jgi:Histidine kinase-, DNA gyrase B-, and HSP90-like ATPase
VPLTDVARAAISEIEQYSRVTLNIQPGVLLAGTAVSDVVHLLAEVVENATTFSPRDTPVQMTAQQVSSGGVLVEVADSGVGIPAAVLAELNDRLDNSPVMDVSVSRHMGLFAVARLAERHGIRVRLRVRPPQGIIAMVWLPDTIILQGDRPFGRLHPSLRHIGVPGRRPGGASRSSLPAQPALPTTAVPDPVSPRPAVRAASVASSKWFTDPHAGQSDGPRLPAAASMTAGQGRADQGHSEQGLGEQTRSGLPLRVPRANLAPGLADTTRRTDITRSSYQPDHHEPQTPGQQWAHRTPDIARSRLSGFQRGVRRGKSQTPSAGEGIDR